MTINKLFSIVFLTVFISAFSACIRVPESEYIEPGIIHIDVFHDGSPIVGEDLFIDRADPDMPGITIILVNPWLYDEGSIVWRILGTAILGNGPEFFIDAHDPAFKNFGFYYVNVSARIDGAPYGRTFTLRLFNSNEENDEQ